MISAAAGSAGSLNGLWALLAGVVAAVAAAYATASARQTARGAQELERDRIDREATDRKQVDLQAQCDRCVEELRTASRELVEAYKVIGQYQERDRQHATERDDWEAARRAWERERDALKQGGTSG